MDDIVMIIMSCDAFSDLWDGYVRLLEQNWPNRHIKAVIVTDKETVKKYERVDVFCPPYGANWSERLHSAVLAYKSEHYLRTLDDYYLVEPVDNTRISELINLVDAASIDYLRLFKHPVLATKESLAHSKEFRVIDLGEVYSVNLYPAIWRKEFLLSCFRDAMNIWQFEVSLTDCARNYDAKCVVDLTNDFKILDVVRKGKLIRKAGKYIKKRGLYTGNRDTNSIWFELGLGVKVLARRYLPDGVRLWVRRVAIRCGMHSYSNNSADIIDD